MSPIRKSASRATIESLEPRALLSASYLISFYGLGGKGGFGNDWLDNIADQAGSDTGSAVRKYDEDQGGFALRDFLKSVDHNHDNIIESKEVHTLSVRVVGYSFGGIQAANFAQDLNSVGSTIKGFLLDASVPIRSLVTLDPVNSSPLKHTVGVPSNVSHFFNYYQQKGGDTKVDVYTRTTPSIKVTSISVPDPDNITGDVLPSAAHKSYQVRIDTTLADEKATHKVESGLDGKITGHNVNHGTVPFFAYDLAVASLML